MPLRSTLCTTLFCLFFTTGALALEAEKREPIDELLDIMESRKLSDLMARNLTFTMVKALAGKYGNLDRAVADIIYQEAQAIMYEQYILSGKLNDIFYDLYDEYYTAEELQALVRFYKSPAGRRMLEVGDRISTRSIDAAREHAMSFGPMAQKRIQKKLEEASSALAESAAQAELEKQKASRSEATGSDKKNSE